MNKNRNSFGAIGRPPGATGIRAHAARHAHECIRVLAEVAADRTAAASDRVRAAEIVLGHAMLKPRATALPDEHP